MAPSGTVSKLKVKVYTIVIEILLYQFRFECDITIKYFIEYLLFFHKLSIRFYSVEDCMINFISAWIDQAQ